MPLSTDQETHDYIHSNYYSKASSSEITQLMQYYPPNPIVGSPFDTGDNNTLTPQYKRISALTGDIIFEAPRRFFLDYLSSTQPAWAFRTCSQVIEQTRANSSFTQSTSVSSRHRIWAL